MSFGQTLRNAREAKGLSTSELAAQTHLLVQIVEGLENEDFRRIPAPTDTASNPSQDELALEPAEPTPAND